MSSETGILDRPIDGTSLRVNQSSKLRNIYFIQMGSLPCVKVGMASDVISRLLDLQCASPYPLDLLFCFPGDARTERLVHQILARDRLLNEWFSAEAAMKLLQRLRDSGDCAAEVEAIWRETVRDIRSQHLSDRLFRKLIGDAMQKMCADDGPSRVAIDIGCEEKTVRRARDKETSLRSNTTFNLLARDTSALDPILAHFGGRFASTREVSIDVAAVPCNVAEAVPTLIRLFADGDASEADIRQLDREGIIDRFIEITDMMTRRREEIQLRVVGQ